MSATPWSSAALIFNRIDVLEAVAAGTLTLSEAAVSLGKTEAELSRQLEVLELAGALNQRQA